MLGGGRQPIHWDAISCLSLHNPKPPPMLRLDPSQLSYNYNLRYTGRPFQTGAEELPAALRVTLDVWLNEEPACLLPPGRRVGHAVMFMIPDFLQAPPGIFDEPELQDIGDLLLQTPLDTLVSLQHGTEDTCLTVVSSINIAPEFRGQKLSHLIMDSIRDTVGRSGSMLAIKATTVEERPEGAFPLETSEGRKTLEAHWEAYGFVPCAGGLMIAPIKRGRSRGRTYRYSW